MHLRKALETCAFAARIAKHPHMATVWIKAGNGDEAFEKFRKTFKRLFPEDDPQLKRLGEHYDICSKATHGGLFGVAHHFARTRTPSAPSIDAFDVGTDGKLVVMFMTAISIHLNIIRVFERLLGVYTQDRIGPWLKQLATLEEKFKSEHKRLLPLIEAEVHRLKSIVVPPFPPLLS